MVSEMHEVGIMQSALDIALEWAQRQGAARIHRLGLRVGALSGVVPDALEFAFEVLKQDTPAATARLEVETIPLRAYCPDCEREFTAEAFWVVCPDCDRMDTEIRQGRELEVAYVELSSDGEGVEGASDEADAGGTDG
jgi:hydrogenase nickel incorporation protein HypA/HybF